MSDGDGYNDYGFHDTSSAPICSLLWPVIDRLIPPASRTIRVLDVGCGNGALCGRLVSRGYDVTGIDLSESGIAIATAAYPSARFSVVNAADDYCEALGVPPFDVVVSTEVIEHVYQPRSMVRSCLRALKECGLLILSTPYHGYLKNLAISIAGRWDDHANPLWDGGHIKLWSKRTLRTLLVEQGFGPVRFYGVGRMPYLWMSMIAATNKPSTKKRGAS